MYPKGRSLFEAPRQEATPSCGATERGGAATVESLDPEPQLRPTPPANRAAIRARQPPKKAVKTPIGGFRSQTKPLLWCCCQGCSRGWCPGTTGAAAGGPKGCFPPHTPHTDRCPGRRRRMGPGGGSAGAARVRAPAGQPGQGQGRPPPGQKHTPGEAHWRPPRPPHGKPPASRQPLRVGRLAAAPRRTRTAGREANGEKKSSEHVSVAYLTCLGFFVAQFRSSASHPGCASSASSSALW